MLLKDSLLKAIFNINMDQILNIVSIRHTDNEINGIIEKCKEQQAEYAMHFSQNEEFFLRIAKAITIPHLRIHHNIKNPLPDKGYTEVLASVIEAIIPFIYPVLEDTRYFFDPLEPLRPVFYKHYIIEERIFLYMARLDISFKPHDCEILESGGNDITHIFRTDNIFLDVDILPVDKIVNRDNSHTDYIIRQSVSQTWIGETGRGYFIQGIWMDSELTKFFTRLFLPEKSLSYPYYPFPCKYRTITHFPLKFAPEKRNRHVEILDRSYNFLDPYMREIEEEFKNNVFSPQSALFREIKGKIESRWYDDFSKLKVKRYLNSRGMKEYELEI